MDSRWIVFGTSAGAGLRQSDQACSPVSACPARGRASADRRLVVHLEGQRERRVPGQPEPADLAVAAQRPGRAHGVVVEAAGHRAPGARPAASSLGGVLAARAPRAPPRPAPPPRTRPAAPGSARSRRPRAAPPRPAGRRARPRTARSRRPGRAPRRWPVPGRPRRGAAAARRARRGRRRCGRAAGRAGPAVQLRYRPIATRATSDPDEGCGHGRQGYRCAPPPRRFSAPKRRRDGDRPRPTSGPVRGLGASAAGRAGRGAGRGTPRPALSPGPARTAPAGPSARPPPPTPRRPSPSRTPPRMSAPTVDQSKRRTCALPRSRSSARRSGSPSSRTAAVGQRVRVLVGEQLARRALVQDLRERVQVARRAPARPPTWPRRG